MEAQALVPHDKNSFSSSTPRSFNTLSIPHSAQKEIEQAVSAIFPTEQQENKVLKARKILGEVAKNVTDEEIEVSLTKFEYLITAWLDEFERQNFEGKTLHEIVRSET